MATAAGRERRTVWQNRVAPARSSSSETCEALAVARGSRGLWILDPEARSVSSSSGASRWGVKSASRAGLARSDCPVVREMMSGRARPEPWIDADEEETGPRSDDSGMSVFGRDQLVGRRSDHRPSVGRPQCRHASDRDRGRHRRGADPTSGSSSSRACGSRGPRSGPGSGSRPSKEARDRPPVRSTRGRDVRLSKVLDPRRGVSREL